MKNGTENSAKSQSEKAVELFTEMMIDRMAVGKRVGLQEMPLADCLRMSREETIPAAIPFFWN